MMHSMVFGVYVVPVQVELAKLLAEIAGPNLHTVGRRFANTIEAERFLLRSEPPYPGRVVAKQQEFHDPWGQFADAVREDRAQLPPMVERLRRDPETAHNFLLALHNLALVFGTAMPTTVWPWILACT